MTDLAWIDAALTSARPQAVGALLRYFRDLDTAEEAYQEACLRALKTWPEKGPRRGERRIDPGEIGHPASSVASSRSETSAPLRNRRSGRSS